MGKLTKYLFINKLIVFTFCLGLFSVNLQSQNAQFSRFIDSIQYVNKLDSLNLQFGNNKTIPNNLKLCSLIALTHYVELNNQRIVFKEARIKTTLNARPAFFSLFHFNKNKRKYIIRINCSKKDNNVSVYDTDFNGKIGLLGHEFAHLVDYQHSNLFGIIKRAFSYLSTKSKKKYECEIDNITIKNGLGWQLYDWSYFVLNKSHASEKYKEFKRKTYMTPEQILNTMNNSGFFTNSD